jgi:hypothetical protein
VALKLEHTDIIKQDFMGWWCAAKSCFEELPDCIPSTFRCAAQTPHFLPTCQLSTWKATGIIGCPLVVRYHDR